MSEAVIYTDGACSGNPGPGGWGAVLRYGNVVRELHGGERATTNNRMELLAAISALEALTRPVPVQLYTDSKYVLDGITKWLPGWQRNGWKTASKQPVKNVDLWQRLVAAMAAARGHLALGQGPRRRPGQRARRRAGPRGHRRGPGHPALKPIRPRPGVVRGLIGFMVRVAGQQRP